MATAIRVMVVDDFALAREGFRMFLEQSPDISVVAEARDGKEALRVASKSKPDVVLMDMRLPTLDGLEAARRLRVESPQTRVLMVTAYDSRDKVAAAIRAGVDGFLLKDTTPAELNEAVREVFSGRTYFSRKIRAMAAELTKSGGREASPLSQRETEVLRLIASGLTNRETGIKLGISVRTVEAHRENIMDKLDVRTPVGLARYALRQGLVSLDTDTE